MDFFIPCEDSNRSGKGTINWWQLSLIGVGCTIGTGYFLGSTIGIKLTGPSIIFSFILAAIGTYIVYRLLAKMTKDDPQEGSFCYYANKAYGRWAGFSCGWNYWSSNILIMGSQLTALSILSKFWFPNLPLWVFTTIYAFLSVIVVLTGTSGFDKVENILAIIKFAAIVMFIILAFAGLIGWLQEGSISQRMPNSIREVLPEGFKGFWVSLIYAFYAYGGIEVIGLMATRLKKKEDASKAGLIMLVLLAVVYVTSIGLTVIMVSYESFNLKESAFVTAMDLFHLPFFPHVFNGAIIIAGFSTMTASLYGVVELLVAMAESNDAPKIFAKRLNKWKKIPLFSLALAVLGLLASIIAALLLPEEIYEYITTAAGILLLINWAFIIITSLKLLKVNALEKVVAFIGLILLIAAMCGTLLDKNIRIGFFLSILFAGIIGIATLIMQIRIWNIKQH